MDLGFDAIDLARFQFAFTVSFHIIFPAFSIGLASYLMVLEWRWLRTGEEIYLKLFNYWKTIFAVAFGMGVVSGIVMSYQFGTNWSAFSDKTGPILGPLMGYEVLSAFFLEAGFLGVMLFGLHKVGPRLHFFATCMVAGGTLFSAFWILSVNSWMQTPRGYGIVFPDPIEPYALEEIWAHVAATPWQFVPEDWWAIVFNPSFPYRLVHMVLAAYLTTAFVVGAAGAWHLLRDRANRGAQIMFSMAMWMALLVTPLQIVAGDLHGLNTLEHQPAKIAAMEGHWETERGAALILFGIPDDEAEVTRYKIEIPYASALILTHSWDGETPGLKDFPVDERPPSELIFWTFRIMVGIGFAMLAVGIWSGIARLRGTLGESRWLHRAVLVMGPSGFVAVVAGWITTEVGRQPYTVFGLLTTANSASPLDAPAVGASLIAFIVVYFAVFGAGTYYLFKLMAQPPDRGVDVDQIGPTRTAGLVGDQPPSRGPAVPAGE